MVAPLISAFGVAATRSTAARVAMTPPAMSAQAAALAGRGKVAKSVPKGVSAAPPSMSAHSYALANRGKVPKSAPTGISMTPPPMTPMDYKLANRGATQRVAPKGVSMTPPPAAARPLMNQKQAAEAFRKKRQAEGKEITANRDAQREATRKEQLELTRPNNGGRKRGVQIGLDTVRDERDNQKSIADELDKLQQGRVYQANQVAWLDEYSGEEREAKEAEMLQSIRDRGVFTYVDSTNGASWVETPARDNFDKDWDAQVKDQYAGKYADIAAPQRGDNVDFDRFAR